MLNVYSKNRQLLGVLDNAFDIEETLKLNEIDDFVFKLPFDDPKNEYCKAYNLVQMESTEGISQFYVIVDVESEKSDVSYITYNCEGVISLLLNDQIRDFVSFGGLGYYTREVIEAILQRQRERRFVLDRCEFSRQFEYGFEKESILSSLFSIPRPFSDQYIWSVDSISSYPYKISLDILDALGNPDLYVRFGYNQLKLKGRTDYKNVCTVLYAYGMGEGVNQIQAGPFYASPQAILEFGYIERNWIDRRYGSVETLAAAAQVLVDELSNPRKEWSVDILQFDKKPYIGQVVYIEDADLKTYVTEIKIKHDEVVSTDVTIANKSKDVATDIANLADRQRIEASYSQGATNIYSGIVADNADSENPLRVDLYFTRDMIFINQVMLKIRMESFRAYSATTEDAGESVSTSSSGGGSSQTSSSGGGGTSTSSSGGGGSSRTTSEPSNLVTTEAALANITGYTGETTFSTKLYSSGVTNAHTHTYRFLQNPEDRGYGRHRHLIWVDASHSHGMNHTHEVSVSFGSHSHSVSIPNHSHSVNIPSHTHEVEVPSHEHEIIPGIHKFGSPSSMRIFVGGIQKAVIMSNDSELDVLQYLLDSEGKIPRDQYSTVEIYPNDIAHIQVTYNVVNYIQSRGGNRY